MNNLIQAVPSKKNELLRSYLEFPAETATVDYKKAFRFNVCETTTKKFIKDILGMANAGGGHLVLGYEEDSEKKLIPQTRFPNDFLRSYDPSNIAGSVEEFINGTDKIELNVHKIKHPSNGNIYPIIEVLGFTNRPFFCAKPTKGDDGKTIFERGDICIRIAAARTTLIAGPSEWEQLIELCVSKKQDDLARRFASVLRAAGLITTITPLPSPCVNDAESLKKRLRNEAKSFVKKKDQTFEGMELFHYPLQPLTGIKQGLLREIAARAAQPNTGWPIGAVLGNNPDMMPKVVSDGITTEMASGEEYMDYWHFNKSGAFYTFRNFEERCEAGQKKYLYFDTRIWRVAECLKHCISLYEGLEIQPDSTIAIELAHFGLKERTLSSSNALIPMYERRKCSQDQAEWKKNLTLDLLKATFEDLVYEICQELFLLFDFFDLPRASFDKVLGDYLESRVR